MNLKLYTKIFFSSFFIKLELRRSPLVLYPTPTSFSFPCLWDFTSRSGHRHNLQAKFDRTPLDQRNEVIFPQMSRLEWIYYQSFTSNIASARRSGHKMPSIFSLQFQLYCWDVRDCSDCINLKCCLDTMTGPSLLIQ